jgi:transcriptional regulator with XRE-family HTH domain
MAADFSSWYKRGCYPGIGITTMAPSPAAQKRALGDFLRAQRARLSPVGVGLPAGQRRRTPGLRREEVAQQCGMSVTWYTWLEQGRDVSASPQALAALAGALHLTPAERSYLFELAGKRDPAADSSTDDVMDVPPVLAGAVATVKAPAYLLDHLWNARAWNAAAARLFLGWLDRDDDRNLLRYVFLNPTARKIIPDWNRRARRVLAEFRAESGRHIDDPALVAMVDDIKNRSAFFARSWRDHEVVDRLGGERTFDHPRSGRLAYEQVAFTFTSRIDFKLVMLLPSRNRDPSLRLRSGQALRSR